MCRPWEALLYVCPAKPSKMAPKNTIIVASNNYPGQGCHISQGLTCPKEFFFSNVIHKHANQIGKVKVSSIHCWDNNTISMGFLHSKTH